MSHRRRVISRRSVLRELLPILSSTSFVFLAAVGDVAAATANRQPGPAAATACTLPIATAEITHGIPPGLLLAVGLAESGRSPPEGGAPVPWPWTVGAEGRGQWFSSKAEAAAEIVALRSRGVQNIDVGCMQVNLQHHPDAFADDESALDPASNVAYAGRFLRSLFVETSSWREAVGRYHTAEPGRTEQYAARVMEIWQSARGVQPLIVRLPTSSAAGSADGQLALIISAMRASGVNIDPALLRTQLNGQSPQAPQPPQNRSLLEDVLGRQPKLEAIVQPMRPVKPGIAPPANSVDERRAARMPAAVAANTTGRPSLAPRSPAEERAERQRTKMRNVETRHADRRDGRPLSGTAW